VRIITLDNFSNNYLVISGINDDLVHDVLITKRTEPVVGIVSFKGIVLHGGELVDPPSPFPTRKIELYGDSITCGYGNQGIAGCTFEPPTENNLYSYGAIVADLLNAQFFVQAWGGKGVVRNCCNQTNDTLPTYLPLTVANYQYLWDFHKWVPDAILINLGTNDFGTPPVPSQQEFVDGFVEFILAIKAAYAPSNPHFFLLCGPLLGDPACEYVQIVASQVQATYIDLQGLLTIPYDYGCNAHPAVSGHLKMAEVIVPVIENTMQWT